MTFFPSLSVHNAIDHNFARTSNFRFRMLSSCGKTVFCVFAGFLTISSYFAGCWEQKFRVCRVEAEPEKEENVELLEIAPGY
jgi:hypothetical protein